MNKDKSILTFITSISLRGYNTQPPGEPREQHLGDVGQKSLS